MLKKFSFILVLLFGLGIIFYACDSPPILAQPEQQAVEQTSASLDIGKLLGDVFASVPGLAGLVLAITAYVKKKNNYTGQFVIFLSVINALILSAIGFFLKAGIFVDVGWYYIFIYGLAACLIANGLADWNLIKSILTFLRLKTGTVAVILIFITLTAAATITNHIQSNKRIEERNISNHLFIMNMQLRN